MTAAIDVVVSDGIATITIDSPKTRNALDPESSQRLVEACDQVDLDPAVGAVIVHGGGGTFCSGADRSVLARAGEDPADPERFADVGAVYDAFVRVGSMSVPTIAAVEGAAVGAGVNLLLAADLRIVARDARIIGGFARIGLHPGGGHFTLLGRLVGRETAAAVGLFGAEVSGSRAAELGLAWEAVEATEVYARAREIAATVAHDPELARRIIASLRAELGPPGVPWSAALEIERGAQMWSLRRLNLMR